MSISLVKIQSIRLVGGLAVLDFLNSCNGRRPGSSLHTVTENLLNFEDVLYWFQHGQLVSADELAHFLTLMPTSPSQQCRAYEQLIAFRESLYHLFLPIAARNHLPCANLQALNKALADTSQYRQLEPNGMGAIWSWRRCGCVEEVTASLIGRLAIQAAILLTSPDLARLKICQTLSCDWLFIDTSKNGRRRWCQMTVCGSREKAKKALSAH